LNEKLKESYERDEIAFLEVKIGHLKRAAETKRLKTTWEIVHELSGKSDAKGKQKMKNPVGKPIQSSVDLLKEWGNYFEGLPNVEQTNEISPAESDLNINTGPISLDEIQKTVESLKKR
jgi:hypothetical protein